MVKSTTPICFNCQIYNFIYIIINNKSGQGRFVENRFRGKNLQYMGVILVSACPNSPSSLSWPSEMAANSIQKKTNRYSDLKEGLENSKDVNSTISP